MAKTKSIQEHQTEFLKEGAEGMAQIFLAPMFSFHFFTYIMEYGAEEFARRSSIVGFAYPDIVLAKTRKGNLSLFQQFKCFNIEIYISILFSIVLISVFMSLYKRSLNTFFRTFWSYSSIILSDHFSHKVNKSIERLLSGIWLMSCTVLLAAFSGQLRESLIKPKPIHWIDSWEDLFAWEHLKIETFRSSNLNTYIDQFEKENGKLKERLKILEDELYINNTKTYDKDIDYEGVRMGVTALVHNHEYMDMIKLNLIKNNFQEDIDFHISKSGGIPQSFTTLTNRANFNETLAMKWDLM